MICINCGRPLSDKVCNFCGTDYRTDEEKNKVECDHKYDEVFYEEDIRNGYKSYLIFKCYRCGKETRINITQRLKRNLTGGYL